MRYWIVLLLAGCASQTVLDMGAGRHSVTGSSFRGMAGAREDATEQANDFCAPKHAVIESFDDKNTGGSYLKPTSSAVFRCE